MLKKIALSAVAAATAFTALPAAAEAQGRYYGGSGYERSYRDYDRYEQRRYDQRRYDQRRYAQRRYAQRHYQDQRYSQRHYDGRYYRKCSGTTGTIVGGAAGALLGREVVGYRGDRTAGTIIGGTIGALAGRAVDKGACRR